MSFNAWENTKPVYRGSLAVAPAYPEAVPDVLGSIGASHALKDSASSFGSPSNSGPPVMPYPSDVCAPNTFASDSSVSPAELRQNLIQLVEQVPVDVEQKDDSWDFRCVYYPHQIRTAFEVRMFRDTAAKGKNACLVEIQLSDGDRCAFEGLCAHVRQQTGLTYAFTEGWDSFFDADAHGEEFVQPTTASPDTTYTHRSFSPLPLPMSLLRSSDSAIDTDTSPKTSDSPFAYSPFGSPSERSGAANNLVDVLKANIGSPFADVRRTGWQELARATCQAPMAQALELDGFGLVEDVLEQCRGAEDSISADTERCALRTLLNVSRSLRTSSESTRTKKLKEHVMRLASSGKSLETRSLAVDLVQQLLDGGEDSELVDTLRVCGKGSSRVSAKAQRILESLKV